MQSLSYTVCNPGFDAVGEALSSPHESLRDAKPFGYLEEQKHKKHMSTSSASVEKLQRAVS